MENHTLGILATIRVSVFHFLTLMFTFLASKDLAIFCCHSNTTHIILSRSQETHLIDHQDTEGTYDTMLLRD